MENNKSIIIMAIIFGLTGIGLSGYNIYSQIMLINDLPSEYNPSSWYVQHLGIVVALPSQEQRDIPDLNITISLNDGEGVVFYYNGLADLTGWAYMNFWITIDGTTISDSHIGLYVTADPFEGNQFPVSITYASGSISQGFHNVSVMFNANNTNQAVFRSRFFIQTFIL